MNDKAPQTDKTDPSGAAASAAAVAARLRAACNSVRARSVPLAELIPLMQQAADVLEAAATRSAPAPLADQAPVVAPRAQRAEVVESTGMPQEVWDLIHEWRDTLDNERADWIERRVNELWRLGPPPGPVLADALDEFGHQLAGWAKAYPLSVFPEPDLAKVRAVLEKEGMTLDAVSASNMRHVTTRLNDLFAPVRSALAAPAPAAEPEPARPAG